MKCRDLREQLPALELFATRKIDPALRVKFAQRLLKLRDAHRVLGEELQSLARRYARVDEHEKLIYGPEDEQGNRSLVIDDVAGYNEELRAMLDAAPDVVVQPFGEELLAKAKDYTATEVAALIVTGLYAPPPEAPEPASGAAEDVE
jgi:hypothetical protein